MRRTELAALLQSRGIRPTAQRLAVYEYLLSHSVHPSVDTVYEAVSAQQPSFSRTTVYNSLHALVEAGLVRELPLCSEERRYDAGLWPHAHFRCVACGGIWDVPLDESAAACAPPDGCVLFGREVSMSGLCAACHSADSDARASV